MTPAIVTIAYLLTVVLAARWFYGRWRGELTGLGDFERYCRSCRAYSRGLASDQQTVVRVIGAAFIWPLALLVLFVVWRPPPSAHERRTEKARLTKRIAELENEAGIDSAKT